MSIKTATVESLTAEVRVLMVGSRQITLSVVRQLDEVGPDGFEPFGRVRAARQPDDGDIEVVGSIEGVLAYSVANLNRYDCSPQSGSNRCVEHHNALVKADLASWATLNGARPPQWAWRYREPQPDGRSWAYVTNDLTWQRHRWFQYYPDYDTYKKWAELPLIVLAGLR